MEYTSKRRPNIARRKRIKAQNATRSGRKKKLQSVRVRMYRQGLGDCFLLTFSNAEGQKHHMMIDCGVLPFSSGGNQRLDFIAENILAETGRNLDTVIATHEHADHISGFKTAGEILGLHPEKKPDEPVHVDQVWLAWTENQEDPQVKKIVEKANALSLAITASLNGMDAELRRPIRDILLFSGYYLGDEGEMGAAAGDKDQGLLGFKISRTMQEIMESLREWGPVEYLEPNDVRKIPDFGVRIYVLGPSRKMRMLGGEAPVEGETGQGLKLSQSTAFLAAAAKFSGLELEEEPGLGLSQSDLEALYTQGMPFDRSRSIPLDEIRKPGLLDTADPGPEKVEAKKPPAAYRDFFKKYYGYEDGTSSYGEEWRRIDNDWLQLGENLALQQVSTVNNTSLVMAIELVESGKVLLFCGDAEEESWETWENENVDLDKLLANTVLYKVGHHGSINATDQTMLKTKMTNKELVAVIPVDMKRAEDKKWEFPAKVLYNPNPEPGDPNGRGLLFTQTAGRVLVNCSDLCVSCDPSYDKALSWPGKITVDDSEGKLWVDYLLEF
jgi:hypothetical protein